MLGPWRMATMALGLLAAGSAAADTAVLIGNSRYDDAQRIRGAHSIVTAQTALREVGFDVITALDASADEIREILSDVLARGEDERILIAVSGYFAHGDDGHVWFLGTEAAGSDRATIGAEGIALDTIYALAAGAPGQSVVLLGTESRAISFGPGLSRGIPTPLPAPPQGVGVVAGAPRTMTEIAVQSLPRPGVTLAQAVEPLTGIAVAGFVTDLVPFIPETTGPSPATRAPVSTDEDDLWAAVQELNTEGAYISYLRQYPTGQYASEARAAFEALRDPLRLAAEAESAMGLDRSDRRQIQSDLTLLGYDTNGIDGIFGNGTRGAIRQWQASVGLPETGHLDEAALRLLRNAAVARQAERDRQDRAYWTATGQGQDEAGLRAYLGRFPEGLYADIATARLAEIETAAAEAEAAAEADAWDFALSQDSVRGYQGYLAVYPDGAYEREARNRIAELRGQPLPFPDENVAELEAIEAALNLPGITRMLIERRLADQGYSPGTPDGRFDDQTRAAISAFQENNGLSPTGYLDQTTLRRFLADGIQVIIR